LLQFFTPSDIQRLELHGGRILISITDPYSRKNKQNIKVNNQSLEKIEKVKDSRDRLQEMLADLTVKQLRQLCGLIDLQVKSSASAYEIRTELVNYFQSEYLWRGISGTPLT